jgi:hypothetical protein
MRFGFIKGECELKVSKFKLTVRYSLTSYLILYGLKRRITEPPPDPSHSTKVGLGKEGCSGGSGDNVFLPSVLAVHEEHFEAV